MLVLATRRLLISANSLGFNPSKTRVNTKEEFDNNYKTEFQLLGSSNSFEASNRTHEDACKICRERRNKMRHKEPKGASFPDHRPRVE